MGKCIDACILQRVSALSYKALINSSKRIFDKRFINKRCNNYT